MPFFGFYCLLSALSRFRVYTGVDCSLRLSEWRSCALSEGALNVVPNDVPVIAGYAEIEKSLKENRPRICGVWGSIVFEKSVGIEADHFLTEQSLMPFIASLTGNISLMAKTRAAFSTSSSDPLPSGIAPIICGGMRCVLQI